MASATYLEIVNKVLVRLREDTVSTVSENKYSRLIGALVNRVKTELEDAWRWHALRDTYLVTCVPGTATYVLTGSGPDAVVLDAYNTSTQRRMRQSTVRKMNDSFFGTQTPTSGRPSEYIPAGLNVNFDLSIDLWPVPTHADELKFNLYLPQAELTLDTDVPRVPIVPLVEGAIARAIAERGDDGGVVVQSQEALFRELLASAVSRDAAKDETELNWDAT
jgi:hypothetical protein